MAGAGRTSFEKKTSSNCTARNLPLVCASAVDMGLALYNLVPIVCWNKGAAVKPCWWNKIKCPWWSGADAVQRAQNGRHARVFFHNSANERQILHIVSIKTRPVVIGRLCVVPYPHLLHISNSNAWLRIQRWIGNFFFFSCRIFLPANLQDFSK